MIFEAMTHRTNYFGGSSFSIQSSAEKVHTTHNYKVEIADSNDKIMIITAQGHALYETEDVANKNHSIDSYRASAARFEPKTFRKA